MRSSLLMLDLKTKNYVHNKYIYAISCNDMQFPATICNEIHSIKIMLDRFAQMKTGII